MPAASANCPKWIPGVETAEGVAPMATKHDSAFAEIPVPTASPVEFSNIWIVGVVESGAHVWNCITSANML